MLAALIENVGLLYLLPLPLLVGQLVALLLVPSMLKNGAQIAGVGKAVYCYIAQSLGIVLMGIAAFPTLYGVLAVEAYPNTTYAALLFVFTFGGLTFLWHDWLVASVDPVSRQVPFIIHFYTWKLIGLLLLLLSSLSLILQILFLQGGFIAQSAWELHIVLILAGAAVTWCTALPRQQKLHVAVRPEAEPVRRKAGRKGAAAVA